MTKLWKSFCLVLRTNGGTPYRIGYRLRVGGAILLVLASLTSSHATAATQVQIDQARDRAAAWLVVHQRGDGSWGSGQGADLPNTSQALRALVAAGVRGFPTASANALLLNSKPESVDALSRIVLARAQGNIDQRARVNTLVSWIDPEWANFYRYWGAYPRYGLSFADTALAWQAILVGQYDPDPANQEVILVNTLCSILSWRRPDGAWSANAPPIFHGSVGDLETVSPASAAAASILATTEMMLMLRQVQASTNYLSSWSCTATGPTLNSDTASAIASAANFLAAARNPDGGVGDGAGPSSAFATALTYRALQIASPAHTATASLLDYMILNGRQGADGSWNGDAMVTATMLEALSKIASPTVDSDGDGLPDSVEAAMGTPSGVGQGHALADRLVGVGKVGVTLPVAIANDILVNVPYSKFLSVTGGTSPYGWSLTGGSLPPGLLLSPGGEVSGVPTVIGTYSFEYTVADAVGAQARSVGVLRVVRTLPGSGDVNGDGNVDLADVILARAIAMGVIPGTSQQRAQADVTPPGEPDGVIDAADVARIQRKALGVEWF